VGVIGGAFPYTFSLSNAPSGMTINSRTGVITWINPQTSASNIVVTVYDKDGDFTTATWSITVTDSTDDFIFVNSSYSGTETGSITQPYNSVQDIMDLGSAALNKIVYYRSGSYAVPNDNSTYVGGATGCGLSADGGRAHIWIGYPGESVTFNMSGVNASYATWFEAIDGTDATLNGIWFENVTIQSPRRAGWWLYNVDYFTMYNCTIDDCLWNDSGGNPGGVKIMDNTGPFSYYNYIVDSNFTDFTTAHGIGSLYHTNKMLIERNLISGQSANPYTLPAIAIKDGNQYITVRKNQVVGYDRAIAESLNAVFYECLYNEICYNYFAEQTGGFNRDGNQGTTWLYRNTIVGNLTFENIGEGSCEGPWYLENNVLQNSATGGITYYYNCGSNPSSCLNLASNLNASSGIVDASGNLQGDYTSYLGTAGWQIDESEYYGTPPSTPTITGVMTGSIR